MSAKSKANPYSYSPTLEFAFLELYGSESEWYGAAGAFHNPARVQKAIYAACNRIQRRVKDIAIVDDRLMLLVESDIRGIRLAARGLGRQTGAETHVIGGLVILASHLVGYDSLDGKPNRHIVFFQTRDQQLRDDGKRHPDNILKVVSELNETRQQFVFQLYDRGFRVPLTANVMNQSESVIKDILVRAGRLPRKSNVKSA